MSGGGVIVIDSLEMFADPARQRTINELLREVSAIDGFTVIATSRAAYGDVGDAWIADDVVEAFGGIHAIEVGELTDTEVEFLVDRAPELRAILASGHPAARIARNLYRLSRLLKASGMRRHPNGGGASETLVDDWRQRARWHSPAGAADPGRSCREQSRRGGQELLLREIPQHVPIWLAR